MKLGILSDSHDDLEAIAKAVALFNAEGVAQVLHAGDIVSPFTFEVFRGLRAPFAGIFGNNDGDRLLLQERSGGALSIQPLIVTHGGLRLAVVHEPTLVNALARSGDFDAVVHGHTHLPEIRRVGAALVLNPGKAARLASGRATAAVLDSRTREARIVEL